MIKKHLYINLQYHPTESESFLFSLTPSATEAPLALTSKDPSIILRDQQSETNGKRLSCSEDL